MDKIKIISGDRTAAGGIAEKLNKIGSCERMQT